MGYHQGGFDVVGVDKYPQPRYPFQFVQMDALEALQILLDGGQIGGYYLSDFYTIHASPPCQRNSTMTKGLWKDRINDHPELIAPTRKLLIRTGKPYIIENVPTAPLINPTVLCGSMFGLQVRKHRLFETTFPVLTPPAITRRKVESWQYMGTPADHQSAMVSNSAESIAGKMQCKLIG